MIKSQNQATQRISPTKKGSKHEKEVAKTLVRKLRASMTSYDNAEVRACDVIHARKRSAASKRVAHAAAAARAHFYSRVLWSKYENKQLSSSVSKSDFLFLLLLLLLLLFGTVCGKWRKRTEERNERMKKWRRLRSRISSFWYLTFDILSLSRFW